MVRNSRMDYEVPHPIRKRGPRYLGLILVSLLLFMNFFFSLPSDAFEEETEKDGECERFSASKTRAISLSGEVDIYDAIDSIVYGKDFGGAGHRMGIYSYIDDINGDGYNDLAVVSQEDCSDHGYEGDGRIYIFLGNESGFPEEIDLEVDEPDYIIVGDANTSPRPEVEAMFYSCLTNQMETGDYNNDGFKDLVVAVPGDGYVKKSIIIWGQAGGWPHKMVVNVSKQTAKGYNFTILNTYSSKDHIPIYINDPHPARPQGGFGTFRDITNDHMETVDINKDGYDDLISAGFLIDHQSYLPRVWTVSIYWGDTGYKTLLYEEQDYSYMGKDIEVGDIDGDGNIDLIVGSPYQTKVWGTGNYYGNAMLFFNISRFKDIEHHFANFVGSYEAFVPINETYDKIIWGSGKYDWFGNAVQLLDIDNDGKDDIFIGSPYADGPANLNTNSGQVYLFKGNVKEGFPETMDADNDAYSVVYGDQGYTPGPPELMGDTLGNRFRIADMDGNGELEFIAALPVKDLPPVEGRQRLRAGMVLVYNLTDLFPPQGGIVQISNHDGIFILHGHDIEDCLGYQMLLEDLDSDGITDLFMTAPLADGRDNSRPRCGEGYFIRGKGLVLKDLTISGPSVKDRKVFLGSGPLTIKIDYRHTDGAEMVLGGELTIDPKGIDLGLRFNITEVLPEPELLEVLASDEIDIEWTTSKEKGSIEITLEPDWNMQANKWKTVRVDLEQVLEEIITRNYPKAVIFKNDVELLPHYNISVDSKKVLRPDRWFTPGEDVTIHDISMVYRDDPGRVVVDAPFDHILKREDGEVLDTKDMSFEEPLEFEVVEEPCMNLEILIRPKAGPEYPWVFGEPGTGPIITRKLLIDSSPPNIPNNFKMGSLDGVSRFSRNGTFEVQWKNSLGPEGDTQGSGVKEYGLYFNDTILVPKKEGGLYATYYTDDLFQEIGMERIDDEINFNWGPWGPSPANIPPEHFSTRWHGWFSYTGDYDKYLKIIGKGETKVFIDGDMVLDWTDIIKEPMIGPLSPVDVGPHRIGIYYRHDTGPSEIRLKYLTDQGEYKAMRSSMLFSPSNTTVIEWDEGPSLEVKLTARDWTDKTSSETDCSALHDAQGPVFDLADIEPWYKTDDIEFHLSVTDGDPSITSGVDNDTIEYRIGPVQDWEDWTSDKLIITEEPFEPGRTGFNIRPDISGEWIGKIQLRSSDDLGNPGTSEVLSFGIDMSAPEITLNSLDTPVEYDDANVSVLIGDGYGSGVDLTTISIRTKEKNDTWSDWEPMGTETVPEGIRAWYSPANMPGDIRLQFRASDHVGNTETTTSYAMRITKPVINHPPVPRIDRPENNTEFLLGTEIVLDAFGTTDDGLGQYDMVKLTWTSSIDGYLGSGRMVSVTLSPGNHTIRLFADDGDPGHNVSRSINVRILEKEEVDYDEGDEPKPKEEDDPLEAVILVSFIAILLLIAVAFVLIKNQRKKEEETTSIDMNPDLDDLFDERGSTEISEE